MTDLLKKVESLEIQAKEYGFYWHNAEQVMQQIHSECKEIEELLDDRNKQSKELQEEIGDLLHAAISLCVYCGYDSKTTLEQALNKFEKRFIMTKYYAKQDGHNNLHGKTVKEMMKYWDMAKMST
jgi:uncharacterized protein YabN with tetrapyrrole methylase and pyrophosphatase domain